MRTILALGFCAVLSTLMFASQDTQPQKPSPKPLSNEDVVGMLKAGLSQEIVIAKIGGSACEFDTSPATLKVLKAANVPDAVILAMVQAPSLPLPAEIATPARVDCNHVDPVPVFSAPRTQQSPSQVVADPVQAFTVKCGDRISILGPTDKGSWLKMRNADGQVGFISWGVVSLQAATPSTQQNSGQVVVRSADSEKPAAEKKREETQKAVDDYDDCRIRAQNEYDTKMNLVNTLTLTPLQRVYASGRLKQNLDAALKVCRSRYESRLKEIEGE